MARAWVSKRPGRRPPVLRTFAPGSATEL